MITQYFARALFSAALLLAAITAIAAPTIKDYGLLPETQMIAISPNGDLVAFRKVTTENDYISIVSLSAKKSLAALDVSAIQPNDIYFINDRQLILVVSDVKGIRGFIGRINVSTAYLYNLDDRKLRQLLTPGEEPVYPGQSGLGRLLGLSPDGNYAYMPAYTGEVNNFNLTPNYSLLRVNLKKSIRPKIHSRSNSDTNDFFLDTKGNVLAKEFYDEKSNMHTIVARIDNKWVEIFSEKTEIRTKSFSGITPDFKALVMIETNPKTGRDAFYNLALADGKITGPLYGRADADIGNVITNFQRVVYGIRYDSFTPSYEFFDAALNKRVKDIQAQFPDHSVELESWTPDWKTLVFKAEGSSLASDYLMYGPDNQATHLSSARPSIKDEDINPIGQVTYTTRDKLKIPTLVTIPRAHLDDMKNMPAILMPHGGPESHDTIGFDWMAQALASQGYLVIQPQFRGSSGFGAAHALAGRGEWGKKMQSDLTDAVGFFVKNGMVDPRRICIAGASYGGYAALAGGAFTPELYRCVVSINGIGNIRDMLKSDTSKHGHNSWVVSYMKEQFTQGEKDNEAMNAISPDNFAANFTAPVLLMHGSADRRVPFSQSKNMHKALTKAHKPVKLVTLKGEDHHLQKGTTRLQALEEMVDFINQHIGPKSKAH